MVKCCIVAFRSTNERLRWANPLRLESLLRLEDSKCDRIIPWFVRRTEDVFSRSEKRHSNDSRWMAWPAIFFALTVWVGVFANQVQALELAPIERRIPPAGIEWPADQLDEISSKLKALTRRYAATTAGVAQGSRSADVGVYLKAVALALKHGEFYRESHGQIALELLNDAEARLDELAQGNRPWKTATGTIVRGYFSSIDGSAQPYGLVVPDEHDFESPTPLYVWLHGRGDKKTDLHFIHERKHKTGEVVPDGAIVLHPFGRHCIGFKSAGEIDVLESIEAVCRDYNIDQQRIVLMGFSMGGAGCWHVGAHYPDRFVAMSPGAGFAETAEYNRLTPDKYPPTYEQKLWGLYDVPGYARNLFSLPVVAYSGEKDKQIQAARVMEAAFQREGRTLPHVIGPGMGHKYHPESLKQILDSMDTAVQAGKGDLGASQSVSLQTRTLRYSKVGWIEALGLIEHWNDSRIDAEILDTGSFKVTTKNVRCLRLRPAGFRPKAQIEIDGQSLAVAKSGFDSEYVYLELVDQKWQFMDSWTELSDLKPDDEIKKRPGLQGPIDDAFMRQFLVVVPTGNSMHPQINQWVRFEIDHLQDRWRALFRGELPVVNDVDLTADQIESSNLVMFGDASSNSQIHRIANELPIGWTKDELTVGSRTYDAQHHVPLMIYPNPLAPRNYIVLNSGPTFRESHDRTNSLQNPKLPDWAILDIRQPPNGEAAGKVVAADFFDEQWKMK